MDPDKTLWTIRDAVQTNNLRQLSQNEIREFADAVEALDAWLSDGGFLPSAWSVLPSTSNELESEK